MPMANTGAASSDDPVKTAVRHDDVTPRALLAYGRHVAELDAAGFARELKALDGQGSDPMSQMRLALLHAQPRADADLARAIGLLDKLMANRTPEAAALKPLARILHVQLSSRARLMAQNEALLADAQSGREAVADLQKKLDALTAIERTLKAPAPGPTENPQ
ncbi:hypothetical protein [Denitromonas iodatirespirans]|uniref:Permease n=1 Tax=Denitromonas iodatirespirans TaxID=2795389 RepID=A0A944D8B8_DENI1|nr:hypothetical protein [Denitromonas iodatirespirans]MBT0960201.1 hypothetical protein [Denitromonas iodatirespirans]